MQKNIESQLENLQFSWQGSDFEEFKISFESDEGPIQFGEKIKKEMQKRIEFLIFCSRLYKLVQEDAIDQAKKIRFIF